MIITSPLTIFWFIIWCFLSWPLGIKDLIFGVMASVLATYLTQELVTDETAKGTRGLFNIKRIGWFIVYIGLFSWECLKANFDVAFRALSPTLPIRPGTLKVPTELKSDIALTFLANSITLTPGMTTIDVDKESGFLYVHFLVIKEKDGLIQRDTVTIRKFESLLKKVFES